MQRPIITEVTKTISGQAEPTGASASAPGRFTTINASTGFYTCCSRLPAIIGSEKRRSRWKIGPSVKLTSLKPIPLLRVRNYDFSALFAAVCFNIRSHVMLVQQDLSLSGRIDERRFLIREQHSCAVGDHIAWLHLIFTVRAIHSFAPPYSRLQRKMCIFDRETSELC